MKRLTWFVTEARKFTTAAAGAVAVAVSSGLLAGDAEKWTNGVIAVATALLVGLVPNDKPKAP